MNQEKFDKVAEKLKVDPIDLDKASKKEKFTKIYYPLLQLLIFVFNILIFYFSQQVRFDSYPYYGTPYKVKVGGIFAAYGVVNLGNIGFSAPFFLKLNKKVLGFLIPVVNFLISSSVGFFSFNLALLYSIYSKKN